MKKIMKEIILYNFDELSEESKEKARNNFLNKEIEIRNDIFYDDSMEYIKSLFKNSDLKCQYSLGYCQGDGFNIYGDLYYKDVFSFLENEDIKKDFKISFTEKEKKTLKFYFEYFNDFIKLEYNKDYAYNIINRIDLYYDMLYVLEDNFIKNINHEVIKKLEKSIKIIFNYLCDIFEKDGYSYLFDIDDEQIKEDSKANGYLFLENGDLYFL